MGADDRIVVHSRLTVVPSKPTPSGKVHPLSVLDHMLQRHFLRTVYCYDASSVKDRLKLVGRLKESLCKALCISSIFAGRLRKRDDGLWEVKCNDAGVRVYEATASVSLKEWLNTADRSSDMELSTIESLSDHTVSPVAVVQFTDFSCGGLAIGFSWLHLVADFLCGTLFLKAWGETYRAAQILHPPFFHPPTLKPRPVVNTEIKSRDYYVTNFFNKREQYGTGTGNEDRYQTVSLSFSHDVVEQCIAEVKNGSHSFGPASPSEVLSALVWIAILRAQGKTSSEEAKLSLCLEFRKIHIPPLPYGYVGNAVHFLGLSSSVGELMDQDLSYAASLINESVVMTDTEDVRSVVDLLQELENQGNGPISKPALFYSPDLTFCVHDHFFCYDVIFDFGKPLHVAYSVEPLEAEGFVIILPTAENNSSRNVTVVLPKEVMGRFCEDSELLKFLPNFKLH